MPESGTKRRCRNARVISGAGVDRPCHLRLYRSLHKYRAASRLPRQGRLSWRPLSFHSPLPEARPDGCNPRVHLARWRVTASAFALELRRTRRLQPAHRAEDRTAAWGQSSTIASFTEITIRRHSTATAVGAAGAAVAPAAASWLAPIGSVLPKAVTSWATRFARKPWQTGAPCLPASP